MASSKHRPYKTALDSAQACDEQTNDGHWLITFSSDIPEPYNKSLTKVSPVCDPKRPTCYPRGTEINQNVEVWHPSCSCQKVPFKISS